MDCSRVEIQGQIQRPGGRASAGKRVGTSSWDLTPVPSPSAGCFQKDALLLKNAKRTTFHRPHKGPPSAQLHDQTRANYVIRPAGADRDPRMVGWRVIFKSSNNEESLIGGTLIVRDKWSRGMFFGLNCRQLRSEDEHYQPDDWP